MQHLDLSDDEAAALIKELHKMINNGGYRLSTAFHTPKGTSLSGSPLQPLNEYAPPKAIAV
jgi:hypothetical protein